MPDRPLVALDQHLRTLRIVHFFILAAGVLYVYVAEKLAKPHPPLEPSFYWGIATLAGAEALIIVLLRHRFVLSSEERLRVDPDELAVRARWARGYFLCFALSLSVCLYGLSLRFMGGTRFQVVPFYTVGLFLLLLSTPRRPPET